MDLRQLKYFVKIVELESITAAAHELFIAQPSLSQHVANLEAELKVKLLNRGAQGTRPTVEGERLYNHAKVILRQVDEARHAVVSGGAPAGKVALGLPSSTLRILGLELVRRAHADFPAIGLEVVEGSTAYLIDLLGRQKLDICIAPDTPGTAGFQAEALVEERLLAVGPASAPARELIPLEELAAQPLVLPALPNSVRLKFEGACLRRGLAARVVAESAAVPILMGAARSGFAWSIMPWGALIDLPGGFQACEIDDEDLRRTLFLCVSQSAAASAACQAVAGLLRTLVREAVQGQAWRHARLVD